MAGRLLARASRYSLRKLLLAMTLCCLALGVWSVYVQPYRDQAASAKALAQLGAGEQSIASSGPGWQRWLVETMVGEGTFMHTVHVDLRGRPLTPEELHLLAGLRYLRTLYLDRSNVDAAGAALLGGFAELETLSLSYAGLTDDELVHLQPMSKLRTLWLTGNEVSNRSSAVIGAMPALQEVYVRWTAFTEQDAAAMQKAMPNCRVHHHALK